LDQWFWALQFSFKKDLDWNFWSFYEALIELS
jgi:hypothetical protein